MKPFIKRDERTDGRTDGRTDIGHFIISRPGPIGRREIKNHTEIIFLAKWLIREHLNFCWQIGIIVFQRTKNLRQDTDD